MDNLEKIFFVNKNWPNDLRIGCKPFYNLVKLIEVDVELEELDSHPTMRPYGLDINLNIIKKNKNPLFPTSFLILAQH